MNSISVKFEEKTESISIYNMRVMQPYVIRNKTTKELVICFISTDDRVYYINNEGLEWDLKHVLYADYEVVDIKAEAIIKVNHD